jgi:hypothetical protein
MTQFFNKDLPFFDNTTGANLAFGIVYFGDPNTDPEDQDNNAKAPYSDRTLATPADSVQTLTAAGKLPIKLYFTGAYSITITDADGVQIYTDPYYVSESTDGIVNDSTVTGASLTDALDDLESRVAALEAATLTYSGVWPIGSLYITTENENPGSRLSVGTWTAFGAGRVMVGVGSGTDANGTVVAFTDEATGGEYTHGLTEAELASHVHAMFYAGIQAPGSADITTSTDIVAREFDDTGNNDQYVMKKASGSATVGSTSTTGSGTRHNNIQPWIGVYFWKRTA